MVVKRTVLNVLLFGELLIKKALLLLLITSAVSKVVMFISDRRHDLSECSDAYSEHSQASKKDLL